MARTLLANPKLSARQVAEQLGVHRATLYRSLARPG
jgi:IS30 family transposase